MYKLGEDLGGGVESAEIAVRKGIAVHAVGHKFAAFAIVSSPGRQWKRRSGTKFFKGLSGV
jgi:hypothetical protein